MKTLRENISHFYRKGEYSVFILANLEESGVESKAEYFLRHTAKKTFSDGVIVTSYCVPLASI